MNRDINSNNNHVNHVNQIDTRTTSHNNIIMEQALLLITIINY